MVFLTVGTTKFSFNRLLEAVDQAMMILNKKEQLIVQKGASDYHFKYQKCKIFKEIAFKKMTTYFKNARIVITHGGPATIFLALKFGKNKPLVVPRSRKFDEHVDEHEIFFADFLKRKKGIEAIFPQENLPLKIEKYLCNPKKSHEGKFRPSKKLTEKLISYTNEE